MWDEAGAPMQTSDAQRQLADLDRELIETNLRAMYAARKRGDLRTWASFFAPNVKATIVSATGSHGFFGTVSGREGMLQSLRQLETEIEVVSIDIIDIVIDADRAVVRRSIKMRGRGTGVLRAFDSFHYYRMDRGLIAEVEQFADTHAINIARGVSPAYPAAAHVAAPVYDLL